jgi:hypothetical protein
MSHTSSRRIVTVVTATVLVLGLAGAARSAHASQGFLLNIGAGLGVPFSGGVGVTAELELPVGDTTSLLPSVAAGHTLLADFGWDVGVKALFLPADTLFRPGIAAYYGTNLLIEDSWGNWTSKEGVSVGLAGRFQLGSKRLHCIDVYVIYPFTSFDTRRYEEDGSKVKLAVGYVLRLR